MATTQARLGSSHQASWTMLVATTFGWGGRRSRKLLDVGRLPDHLKRDMGFLDGNDPCGRRA